MCRTQSKRFCQPCYFIKCADVCQYENGIPYDFPFDLSAVFIAAAGHDVDDANCDVFAKSPGILSVCAFRFCIAGKASRIFVLRRTAQNDKRAETRPYKRGAESSPPTLKLHFYFSIGTVKTVPYNFSLFIFHYSSIFGSSRRQPLRTK